MKIAQFTIVVLMVATIILIDMHYFKKAGRNTPKKCFAMAWTGMALLIMGSLIYLVCRN